jgi:hypothetical protein
VTSIHETREVAETALKKRKAALGRKVWECHTRIVWVENEIDSGDTVGPGEDIPEGEVRADSD